MAKLTLIKTFENSYRLYRILGMNGEHQENYRRAIKVFGKYKSMVFFPEQLFLVPTTGQKHKKKNIRKAWMVQFYNDIDCVKSRLVEISYYSYMHGMRHYSNITKLVTLPSTLYSHLCCLRMVDGGLAQNPEENIGMFNFIPSSLCLNKDEKMPLRNMGALFLDKDEATVYINDVLRQTVLTENDFNYTGW
jgi:hypothetical protein